MDFDDLDQEEEVAKAAGEEKKAAEKAAAEAAAAKRREESERIAAERAAKKEDAKAPAPAPTPAATPAPAPTRQEPEKEVWEVIGGVDKGGIMVREGESTTSTQKADRLSTGALVEQVELKGDRLHYTLKKGTGPAEGWVSIRLTGKDLVIPFMEMGENGPKRRPPPWKVVKQPQIEFGQMKEIANKNDPGDYYGMKFPYSKDMLVEMGPEWLTQAFHKSGVLKRDNAVTKIFDAKEFVGGGAGLKCTFSVEYKKDEPYLHKQLFAKLPHKPGGSDRYYVSCMWNHDRPEIVFNIFLQETVPFRVPKFYFGDISAATTNFILITESLPWAEKGKKVFQPGEIEPAYDKYKDWELPDGGPMYYTACCHALGKMAAYHKQKLLHPKTDEMFPMPDAVPQIPHGLPAVDAVTRKQNSAKADQLIRFVSETARAVFPQEIRDTAFLSKWKEEILEIADYGGEIHCFLSGAGTSSPNDYVGLTHNNLQIDNAFFWRNEQDLVEVGLLDWGILTCGPLAGAVQGCISGASTEVLLEHRDAFLEAFLSSYEQNGGPSLDRERFKMMSNLMMLNWSLTVISNVAQVLKFTKAQEWQEIKDWMDPRLVDRFQTRAHTTQFKESLQLYQKWDLYNVFLKWRAENGIPHKKG
mmetsp:Transcript_58695/g.109882  ORF Transcript_58695/g.109882 Transcript_58695/m.109882 type:complete len:641 (+) Transcript_58695:61-1983(+)